MARQRALEQIAPARSPAPRAAGCGWCRRSVRRVMSQASSQPIAVLVDEQAHQLGDGDGRMGVVELDGELLRKVLQAARCRAACRRIMSWSEQETKKYCWRSRSALPASGSSLGYSTLLMFCAVDHVVDGAVVVAHVEGLQVERLAGLGLPQPEQVHVAARRSPGWACRRRPRRSSTPAPSARASAPASSW